MFPRVYENGHALTDRHSEILASIVRYVETGEPVQSRTISKHRHGARSELYPHEGVMGLFDGADAEQRIRPIWRP